MTGSGKVFNIELVLRDEAHSHEVEEAIQSQFGDCEFVDVIVQE